MKKYFALVFVLVSYADVNNSEVKHILNRVEVFESETKFLQGRIEWLNDSASKWMAFLNERIELATKIEAQIEKLKKNKRKKQKLNAAQFRLHRYLKALACRIGDWKKEFKKERENLKFDISKFNVTKKQDCLSSDIKYLQQSLGCDAQVGTVEKGRAGLKNLKPKISDMQKKISSNEKKIDGDFNQFDLAKDKVALIAKRNRNNFCCFLS
jgi:hypothetical protein